MWQLFIILFFVFGTATILLKRVLAQRLGGHTRALNSIFFFIFLFPTTIILSFFFPPKFPIDPTNLLFLLGGSAIWPILGLISFRANREVDAGIYTIFINLSPLFTLMIALPFLKESLNVFQSIGFGLLIFSGVLAASSQLNKHNRASLNGVLFCLLAAAVAGVAIAYESFMLRRVGFGTYLVFGWGAQIIWSLILAGKELKKIPMLFKDKANGKTVIAWGSVNTLSSVTFVSALNTSGNASIVSAASNFLSVMVVIAAYFFLKERKHMVHKWLGVGIGIAGLLLIAK